MLYVNVLVSLLASAVMAETIETAETAGRNRPFRGRPGGRPLGVNAVDQECFDAISECADGCNAANPDPPFIPDGRCNYCYYICDIYGGGD